MSDRWRCFVAIPIGDRLRSDLTRSLAGWRDDARLADLRWTDPDAWHVTLAFLGWTDPEEVPAIVAAMREAAAGAGPTTLPTGGLGAFPSAGRARVLWYGIADPDGVLAGLSVALHRALQLEPPAAFRGHLTIARARHELMQLREAMIGLVAPAGTLTVEEVRLMRSHLGGGLARYETLASAPLGASAHV